MKSYKKIIIIKSNVYFILIEYSCPKFLNFFCILDLYIIIYKVITNSTKKIILFKHCDMIEVRSPCTSRNERMT